MVAGGGAESERARGEQQSVQVEVFLQCTCRQWFLVVVVVMVGGGRTVPLVQRLGPVPRRLHEELNWISGLFGLGFFLWSDGPEVGRGGGA